ncbi:MAG: AAA family ATPase, partial [Chloroflexi bacterium]|nr:AAA family ATPase [Chloroflexota bacterium]
MSARGALRRTLSTLHKGLADEWLAIEHDQLALTPSPDLEIDVEQFERALNDIRTHGHAPRDVCARCAEPLTRAAALYHGDFLEGFTLRDSAAFDEWQFFQSEHFRRELASTLERLVHLHGERAEFETAINHARRWLALDPLHEPAQRALMRLYAWSGERAAALRQYHECVRVLDAELGVAPLVETSELFEAIQHNKLAGPTSNVERPTSPSATNELPSQTTALPLVGRAREWAALLSAYQSIGADGRFVVIEGEAGIGKTRLADDFSAHVQARGAAVIAVRCYEGEAQLAYAPFAAALRAACAELQQTGRLAQLSRETREDAARLAAEFAVLQGDGHATASDPMTTQARFFESIRQVFGATLAQPSAGVLFVDDVQWADSASLDLLTYLVRRLRGQRLCILVTWRSDEVSAVHRLRQLLGEGQRMGIATMLTLARLDAAAVEQLV